MVIVIVNGLPAAFLVMKNSNLAYGFLVSSLITLIPSSKKRVPLATALTVVVRVMGTLSERGKIYKSVGNFSKSPVLLTFCAVAS